VIRLKQVEHIVNESSLLQTLAHPFICAQVCAFQDARRLYLLLEYVPGGELFSYLRRERVIPEKAARFYASEIVLCYHYLHGLNVAYRDLKPENVLLTRTGHVKLADFGWVRLRARHLARAD
jgi:serine/threonine protein kinase